MNNNKTRVTFLIDKDLYAEYKECLLEDGRILTSDLNKHIRDYIREIKGRKYSEQTSKEPYNQD